MNVVGKGNTYAHFSIVSPGLVDGLMDWAVGLKIEKLGEMLVFPFVTDIGYFTFRKD